MSPKGNFKVILSPRFSNKYWNWHCVESIRIRRFSGQYFPAFGLNTEYLSVFSPYGVYLRIQSKCGKIRTRKNSVFGHLSRSDCTAWKLAVHFPSNLADLKIVEIFFCCVIIIMFIMFIINVTVNGWQCQYPSLCHRDSSILLLSVT